MTDMESIADAIIALINSQPRSPTRDELVGLLVGLMPAKPRRGLYTGHEYMWENPKRALRWTGAVATPRQIEVDTHDEDIAKAINACLKKDGAHD